MYCTTRDTFEAIYLRKFTDADATSLFVKLTFFDLIKWVYSDKKNPIFWKYVQSKGNVRRKTFVNFADISS